MRNPGLRKVDVRRGRPVRLVVIEDGATMVGIHHLASEAEDTVVIGQGHEEPAADLVLRVVHKLSSLEQSGRGVASAVLRVAPHTDESSMEARVSLARALLTQTAAAGSAELVVSAPSDPGLGLRLLALVDEVLGDAGESTTGSLNIRVQFDEDQEAEFPQSDAFASRGAPDSVPRSSADLDAPVLVESMVPESGYQEGPNPEYSTLRRVGLRRKGA